MRTINTNYRIDRDTQSLEELWVSIAKISTGRVRDNDLGDRSYPLDIRERQVQALSALIEELQATHSQLRHEGKE